MDNIAKARLFQQMHLGPQILVIANAWDAASARIFEDAGVKAVGTGSAGVAFSHGYPDDEFIPREVMLLAIKEIVAAVDVPVTADILNGLPKVGPIFPYLRGRLPGYRANEFRERCRGVAYKLSGCLASRRNKHRSGGLYPWRIFCNERRGTVRHRHHW